VGAAQRLHAHFVKYALTPAACREHGFMHTVIFAGLPQTRQLPLRTGVPSPHHPGRPARFLAKSRETPRQKRLNLRSPKLVCRLRPLYTKSSGLGIRLSVNVHSDAATFLKSFRICLGAAFLRLRLVHEPY
jgi:hypothetical protein